MTSIHELAERVTSGKPLPSLKHLALQRVLTGLEVMQIARKNMIALYRERIPQFQWLLVYFLALILLLTVSMIPSHHYVIASVLKGVFSSSVVFVVILLHRFDSLQFFERTIGEQSARDILNIFAGKR